jgi:predicted lipoprotein with Yx(FWY)xxD motif
MSPEQRRSTARMNRSALALTAAAAGVGLAVLAGAISAKTFTLQVAKQATVTNQSHQAVHENIVVDSKGRAVYVLSGDSKSHPECTKANGCFALWPPVTVASMSSLSKAPGVPGKLGSWKRNGFNQVTLSGRPLYTFSYDMAKDQANGQGVKGFGGTWSVVKAATSGSGSPGITTTTTGTTTTGTTTTTTTTTSSGYGSGGGGGWG